MRYPNIAKAMTEMLSQCEWNKAALARKLGTNATSVGLYLDGNRCPGLLMLATIASNSGHSIQWLIGQDDKPATYLKNYESNAESTSIQIKGFNAVSSASRTVPVISKAQAGDFGYWDDLEAAAERIECPADIIDPHAFAFQVEGDSMYPRYMSGEYVIVDTTKQVCNNDDVVVKLHDGAVMVKRYKQISGMVFLESYNPNVEPIPVLDGDMVKCFKIVCRK